VTNLNCPENKLKNGAEYFFLVHRKVLINYLVDWKLDSWFCLAALLEESVLSPVTHGTDR
jgi:hypothetical protein